MRDQLVSRPIEILFIGDNPEYANMTEEALRSSQAVIKLRLITNGEKAMEMMSGESISTGVTPPDLIILDFDLPDDFGKKVLSELKGKEQTKRIPVVVITGMQSEDTIYGIYSMHANCCITKPPPGEQYCALLRTIENFWLNIVRLPSELCR